MLYTQTLNNNKDFLTLYRKGRFTACKYSVIYVKPNGRPYNRLGITASKKIGNAVHRNRAKRLIRLAYRNAEIRIPVGVDIVIVARSPLCEIKSQDYCGYMEKYGVPEIIRLYENFSGEKKKK
ncbi:MAG: ribonuclease P protein component [Ruminococcus sp.]|nr:ribonuclease P protein component [Ruminococcus sp.]